MRSTPMLAALLALATTGAAQAGDPAAAPAKAAVCTACHGANGTATQPIYPHLAGQYADYLEMALKEYRAGSRKNPIMAAQATSLTDADIRELARYFSAQPSPLYTPSVHGNQK